MFYCFECEDCLEQFEISCEMSKIESLKAVCPFCTSPNVFRDYRSEGKNHFECPKTVGSWADRNTAKFSEDYKESRKLNREEPTIGKSLRPK